MFPNFKAALLPALAIAALQLDAAHAQPQANAPATITDTATTPTIRADPVDPKAAVPPASYRSPLSAYQGFAEPQLAPWRDTNELVRQRGGWRAYAREAREPDAAQAPAASQPAPAAKPDAAGHSGHTMQ